MNQIYLSVIIPVYNTEKYLTKLLQSIEFENNNGIEWIFIDDGSEDNSFSILESFSKKYKNVFLEEQEHKGAPIARNRGLYKASGEYIYFFDSDDYFEKEIFRKIIQILQVEKPDLLIGNGYIVNENYIKIGEKFQGIQDKTSNSINELFFIDSNPGNKIFRKNIIIKNEIQFDDVMIHQDLNFYLKYIPFCKKIKFISDYMYFYLIRNDSIAHEVTPKIIGVIDSIEGIYKYYQKKGLLQKYIKELEYNYIKHICIQIEKLHYLKNITEYREISLKLIRILKKIEYRTNDYINAERIDTIDNLLKKENILIDGNYDDLFKEKQIQYELELQRINLYNEVLINWISNKIDKKSIYSYFYENNIYNIAIYGIGTLGKLLYTDLKQSKVNISYFIDQKASETYFENNNLPIIKFEEIKKMNSVDAIVVTPIHIYNDIYKNLRNIGVNTPIFSLQDIF